MEDNKHIKYYKDNLTFRKEMPATLSRGFVRSGSRAKSFDSGILGKDDLREENYTKICQLYKFPS